MGVKKERNYEQNKTNTKTDKQKVFKKAKQGGGVQKEKNRK